ncbi:MAG: hypothetical protein GC146_15530 [Limimaricola sp.]|uniref:GyrI-like domain-containing protein n=1 Tax=Limimaricola sp. TaxID=2211665 RepID=UPI001D1A867A|nr:GyrI-like domain-containing protein [Limimaricola sp.]MBI1418625.1 hypothetical protein [Limimaricola sp.]
MAAPVVQLPPRMVRCGPRHFVGINGRFDRATMGEIPALWARFNAADPAIANSLGEAAYGVVHNFVGTGWDYACAYEVSGPVAAPPDGFVAISFPDRDFAVFAAPGDLSTIGQVMEEAMDWIAASDMDFANGPTLERYGADFDPATGTGGFEVWVAVTPRAA